MAWSLSDVKAVMDFLFGSQFFCDISHFFISSFVAFLSFPLFLPEHNSDSEIVRRLRQNVELMKDKAFRNEVSYYRIRYSLLIGIISAAVISNQHNHMYSHYFSWSLAALYGFVGKHFLSSKFQSKIGQKAVDNLYDEVSNISSTYEVETSPDEFIKFLENERNSQGEHNNEDDK